MNVLSVLLGVDLKEATEAQGAVCVFWFSCKKNCSFWISAVIQWI